MTKVVLNIGGVRFETEEATLQKFSKTRLARECSRDKELFYDRNPYIFSFILDAPQALEVLFGLNNIRFTVVYIAIS